MGPASIVKRNAGSPLPPSYTAAPTSSSRNKELASSQDLPSLEYSRGANVSRDRSGGRYAVCEPRS